MANGSGVSRDDRNRNARLARLRELVPAMTAIVGIDLADAKQMVVVCDHDSKVLPRRTFRCRAWDIGTALDWAAARAAARGFAGVTVACEPTGHRWQVLAQLAADRSMSFVCVQPMVSSWARRAEDLTVDKTDEKDAVLIARLTTRLRCYVPEYVPEPVDSTWARLRHLGARREQLITDASSQVQQIRDLLECVWPTALDTARQPFRSQTWTAALTVIAEVEARMTGVLDELGLTRLATSIPGLSAVGAAAILAQTGDPRRFATARALVKHAGLAPREKLSGAFVGRTKLTGQGRPGLRLAAWRAVWGAQRANPVYAARYRHLTGREHNKLKPTQAQTVIAAAILRHLHAVITTGQAWDPIIATHGTRRAVDLAAA